MSAGRGVRDARADGDVAFRLATALARPTLDDDARETAARLAPVADADAVLRTAHRLGVAPLVASHLADDDVEVPAELESRARDRCRATGTRNLAFVAELHRVLTAFADAHVRCLAYKGPVLAVAAYGDVSRRDFSDLDLFVPPAEVTEACAVLESLGYDRWAEDREWTPDRDSLVSRAADCTYHCPSEGVAVDIRWRLGTDLRPSPPAFDDAWGRRTAVTVGGRPVPTFDAEDAVLVLARHGAKHCWNRLGWVVDVAAFVAENDVDWDRLDARAEDAGLRRVLYACLLLAAETVDAPVPEAVLAAARSDPAVRRVVDDARSFVASNPETAAYDGTGGRRPTKHELLLCDSRRDRLRALGRLAFAPQPKDYAAVSLPSPLNGLYPVVRPARLAAEAVRRRLP